MCRKSHCISSFMYSFESRNNHLFEGLAKICGLNGGTGLGRVMAGVLPVPPVPACIGTDFGIVDGFGEGVGRKPWCLAITGGEGFPDAGMGLDCGFGCGAGSTGVCVAPAVDGVVGGVAVDDDFAGMTDAVGTGIELPVLLVVVVVAVALVYVCCVMYMISRIYKNYLYIIENNFK